MRETHYSCLLSFFARGLFILTFLYPSVLESSQNDMSGPDIGDSRSESAHPKIKIGQKFVRS